MTEKRKSRLIEIAKSLSYKREGRCLHFSFILKNNQLLVTSVNSYTKPHLENRFGPYHSFKGRNDNYIAGQHSETIAIRDYINKFGNNDFTGLTLFNVRLSKTGDAMLAKPCKNCERLLNSFNFKKIDWT